MTDHFNRQGTTMIRKGILLCSGILVAAATFPVRGRARTWYVGPTRTYTTPCQVSTLVADGDTVYIDFSPSNAPGVGYYGDTCTWTANHLSLIGVLSSTGQRPVLNIGGTAPAEDQGVWVF